MDADEILSKVLARRKEKAGETEPDDMPDDDSEGDTVAAALKSTWQAMKAGDFSAASDSFKAAVEACKDEY